MAPTWAVPGLLFEVEPFQRVNCFQVGGLVVLRRHGGRLAIGRRLRSQFLGRQRDCRHRSHSPSASIHRGHLRV